jgi:biopolymer transport protein ExbB
MGLMETIYFLLETGGMATWFILASAIILIVVGAERLIFLFLKFSYKSTEALGMIRQSVLKRDYTKAIQICNSKNDAPDLNVIKAGLMAVEHGREAIKSALGGAILNISKKTEKRVPLVALIAAVSTLLGLLGTISGLIKTFAALAEADASQKGEMLGKGISEAMYATATGLIIGIAAMVVHTLCTSKGDEIVGQSQSTAYDLMTWIEESERSK